MHRKPSANRSRRAPDLNTMIAHLGGSEDSQTRQRPRVPADALDKVLHRDRPAEYSPHDGAARPTTGSTTSDSGVQRGTPQDQVLARDPDMEHVMESAAHRELRLETLSLLYSSRRRTKERESAASVRRPVGSASTLRHDSVKAIRPVPSTSAVAEWADASSVQGPPQSGSLLQHETLPPRPPTTGRRVQPARPAAVSAKEPAAGGFFSEAVLAAGQLRGVNIETRIPQDLWLFEEAPLQTQAKGAAHEERITGYDGNTGSAVFTRRIFPAAAPSARQDVERVARCLDTVLSRRVPDQEVLQDGEAFFALPNTVRPAKTRAEVLLGAERAQTLSPSERALVDEALAVPQDADAAGLVAAPDPYVVAASALLEVADIGLCELVRHTAVTSVSAAALLDNLRAVLVDVTGNCVEYVNAAKAHVEEQHVAAEAIHTQLTLLQERVDARAAERDELQRQLDIAVDEADALRAELLQIREDDARTSIIEGVEDMEERRQQTLAELQPGTSLPASQPDTAVMESFIFGDSAEPHADTNAVVERGIGRAAAKSMSRGPTPPPSSGDAAASASAGPANASRRGSNASNANSQRARRRSSLGVSLRTGGKSAAVSASDMTADPELYQTLVPFLSSLHAAVVATDTACKPLFKTTFLSRPELSVSVAKQRWTAVAKVVGSFETSEERKTSTADSAAASEAELAKHVAIARQLEPSGGMPQLTQADVIGVLQEAAGTMQEVQMRLNALADSPAMAALGSRGLMPPTHPNTPCELCHRLQSVGNVVESKKTVADSDVVEMVVAPLREDIKHLEEELATAEGREAKLKKRLDDTRAKLRQVEGERQRELAAVSQQDVTPTSGRSPQPGHLSLPVSPARRSQGTTRAKSPPLMLELVINCKCQNRDSPVQPAAAGAKSGRTSPGTSRSATPARSGSRRGSLADSRPGSGRSAAGLPRRAPVDDRTSPKQSPRSSSGRPAPLRRPTRRSPTGTQGSPASGSALSVFESGTLGEAIGQEAPATPVTTKRIAQLLPTGGLEPVTEAALEERCDLDQLRYQFPLFASAADPRVLYSLGTASKNATAIKATRTLPWVLKQISAMYRQKLVHDMTAQFQRLPHIPMTTFLFQIAFRLKYGEVSLVVDAAASLFVGCQRYYLDARVDLFARFVAGFYSTRTLHSMLKLQRGLDDVAVGPQYSLSCADDDDNQRYLSVFAVHRVASVMAVRKDASAAEQQALQRLPPIALFYSDPTSAAEGAKALRRAAISETTVKQWTAEEREHALRIVPRSVVLGKYCDFLRSFELYGEIRLDDGDAEVLDAQDGGDENTDTEAFYKFPTQTSPDAIA